MLFTTLPVILSAIPLVLAQGYGGGDGSGGSGTTSTASPQTTTTTATNGVHTVTVGNGGLTFSPNSISAPSGDTVEFHFFGPSHSVAQSSFASPCAPASNTSFFSGFISTTGTSANTEVYTIMINNTDAIWVYCAVPSHCESGMSAVINPPSDGSQTLAMYQQAAMNVANTIAPTVVQGGVLGKAGTSSGSSPSSSTSTAPKTSATNAGVESRGGVQWTLLAITGVMGAGFGSLII